jgi:CheY-like chemotaxis protein
MGYKSDMAANGVECLAAMDKKPYDLIFMDVMMPEMGGLEATAEIRQRQQDRAKFPNYKSPIVIVAMTASAMQGDREKCLEAGMDDYLAKPVKLEDIRTVVERWGPTALTDSAAAAASNGAAPANGAGKSPADAPADSQEPPVDMERLMDFTDGNLDSFRELATLYLTQTRQQIEQLEAAVQTANASEVRRIAHSSAGASATCGMKRLVPILRELERQGVEGKLLNADQLCRDVNREFELIRKFLEAQLAKEAASPAQLKP